MGATLPPPERRWARFGRRKPSWLIQVPPGGLCLSAFVIAENGDSVVLCKPRAHVAWPEKGGQPMWASRELERSGEWRLPATHLMVDESPDDAAARIAHGFTGLEGTPRFLSVQSHLRPNKMWKEFRKVRSNHWDICFVYRMQVEALPGEIRPWWSDIRFFKLSELPDVKMGNHRDILEEAGYPVR